MAESDTLPELPAGRDTIAPHLASLKRACLAEPSAALAPQAAQQAWSPVDSLATLLDGEAAGRRERATQSRMRLARFPVLTTLAPCRWDWPTRLNRLQGQPHFRLAFIKAKANVICVGGVGVGKTHWATAWGSTACRHGSAVLFARAIAVLHTLAAATRAGRLKAERKK